MTIRAASPFAAPLRDLSAHLTKTFIDWRIFFPTVLTARAHRIFTDEALLQYGRYRHIATVREYAECRSLSRF